MATAEVLSTATGLQRLAMPSKYTEPNRIRMTCPGHSGKISIAVIEAPDWPRSSQHRRSAVISLPTPRAVTGLSHGRPTQILRGAKDDNPRTGIAVRHTRDLGNAPTPCFYVAPGGAALEANLAPPRQYSAMLILMCERLDQSVVRLHDSIGRSLGGLKFLPAIGHDLSGLTCLYEIVMMVEQFGYA